MTQFVWTDAGSDNWNGTFGEQANTPVRHGDDSTRIMLECYVGQQKVGELYASSCYYLINHEDEWVTIARSLFRKSKKSFGQYPYPNKSSRLQEMKDWVEGEFNNFIKATGL